MSHLLVIIGGHLGWLRLFWQPFTLYLSHFVFVFVGIVKNKIISSSKITLISLLSNCYVFSPASEMDEVVWNRELKSKAATLSITITLTLYLTLGKLLWSRIWLLFCLWTELSLVRKDFTSQRIVCYLSQSVARLPSAELKYVLQADVLQRPWPSRAQSYDLCTGWSPVWRRESWTSTVAWTEAQ